MGQPFLLNHLKDFNWKIQINGENNYILYFCMSKLLTGIFDSDKNIFFFNATNVVTFRHFLEQYNWKIHFNTIIEMIDSLSKQINILSSNGFSYIGFDLDDILVINKNTFLIINSEYILPLQKNENIMKIYFPPNKLPYFSNPELINMSTLPGTIYIQSLYYSIGVLVIFSLFNEYLLVANEIKDWNTIDKSLLNKIKNTKIYWFLKRCLEDDPKKRILLLI
jgi:hypothetical protein